jgi:anti-anti-sigma regulatory factor
MWGGTIVEDSTHTHAGGRGRERPSSDDGLVEVDRWGGDVHLPLRGSLVGTALEGLGQALEETVRAGARRVYVDVSGVTHWSLLAQAMVLATDRRLSARGGRLVLSGPTAALRRQSRRLDVFHRVVTVPSAHAHDLPTRHG